jgi:hypothetical protein
MSADASAFLGRWHRIVAEKDLGALSAILTEDITMGAPPYWTKLQGRDVVRYLLGIIINTIEDFTYHREWVSGAELALEFTGHVGNRQLQGIDLITLDGDGRVCNVDVMIRPINALIALRDKVAPQMAEFPSPPRG